MLRNVLRFTAEDCRRATVMPNTLPAILSAEDAVVYRDEILEVAFENGFPDFTPLMTVKITEQTTPEIIRSCKAVGVIAGKIYPTGQTTNSHEGVYDYTRLHGVFEEMQKCGMLLLLHGESPNPDIFCLDREEAFLDTLRWICGGYPKLKIVLEHVSTKAAVECVMQLPANVAATITPHHIALTLDDVIGDKLHVHQFCKPVAKRPVDQATVAAAAMLGNPKFFFGSDSAPHVWFHKEAAHACAGIYNAPVALAFLAHYFDQLDKLDMLEGFTSSYGADFYGLARNESRITLIEEAWKVPARYGQVVPFFAGQVLSWKVQR